MSNGFPHILIFTHEDHDSFPIYLEPCSLLILELDRSMWEHVSYYECPFPLGHEILNLEFIKIIRSPTTSSYF